MLHPFYLSTLPPDWKVRAPCNSRFATNFILDLRFERSYNASHQIAIATSIARASNFLAKLK